MITSREDIINTIKSINLKVLNRCPHSQLVVSQSKLTINMKYPVDKNRMQKQAISLIGKYMTKEGEKVDKRMMLTNLRMKSKIKI